jgi:hypothetical protein
MEERRQAELDAAKQARQSAEQDAAQARAAVQEEAAKAAAARADAIARVNEMEAQSARKMAERDVFALVTECHRIGSEYARQNGFPIFLPNPALYTAEVMTKFRAGLAALRTGESASPDVDAVRLLLDDGSRYTVGLHGTSLSAIAPIFSEGFSPLRRSGQVYGPGEYFDLEHGQVAKDFRKDGIQCYIVAIIARGPHFSEKVYTSTKTKVGVVNNDVSWQSTFCLPVGVASDKPIDAPVVDSLRQTFAADIVRFDLRKRFKSFAGVATPAPVRAVAAAAAT